MGRRPDIDGRELLLQAALKLFAEHGVEGVSIRAVNREAGLGPASVHYHFGTKDALVDAVLHAYGDSVIEGVKRRAKAIVEEAEPVDAHALVAMLAEPYLEIISTQDDEGRAWVQLMSQLLQHDPDRILDRPSARLTWNAASRAYPDATPVEIQRAMRMCLTLLVTQLAQRGKTARGRGVATLDVEPLLDFLSAGLDAVLSGASGRKAGSARRTA